jgi:hypothetical protein
MPIFRYFKYFNFAALVYAGTSLDIKGYFPFEFIKKIVPQISIVGFIRDKENNKNGIIIASKYYVEEIKEKKELVYENVDRFAKSLDLKKIALVGRLPRILFDMNKVLFVEGKTGTVFTVINSVKKSMKDLNLDYKKINIAVIGVGFIGKEVLENLKNMNFASITGFDIRIEKKSISADSIIMGSDPELLTKCDLLVILTANGDDIVNLIVNFKKNVIVLDDTHPSISLENIRRIKSEKNGAVYKVAAALKSTSIFPEMPGFKNNWIPGCIVETIVSSYSNRKWVNQDDFNDMAETFGFYAISQKII